MPTTHNFSINIYDGSTQVLGEISLLDESDTRHYFGEADSIALVTSWVAQGNASECFLLFNKATDEFVFGEHLSWQTRPDALIGSRRFAAPYSSHDPQLDAVHIATAMIARSHSATPMLEAFISLADIAQKFLAQIHSDEALSELRINRPLTIAERAFLKLKGNIWRIQAVNADPWLLPLLVCSSHIPDDPFRAVIEAIDNGDKLLPVLADIFAVRPYVIRSMRTMPVGIPSHFEATSSTRRLDHIARYLNHIRPESHPKDDGWAAFMHLVESLSNVWFKYGDRCLDDKTLHCRIMPELVSYAWAGYDPLRHKIPYPYDMRFLKPMQSAIRNTHPLGGKLLHGFFWHVSMTMQSEAWAVLRLLSRNPWYLNTEASMWTRRASHTREDFAKAFDPGCALPVIDLEISLPSGARLVPIRTVGDLIEQSRIARNCLPMLLSDIFTRKYLIFALIDERSQLCGHADIHREQCSDDVYKPGDARGLCNADLDENVFQQIRQALIQVAHHANETGFDNNTTPLEIEMSELAIRTFHKGRVLLDAKPAGEVMDEAVKIFRLTCQDDSKHVIREIGRLLWEDDLVHALARADHGSKFPEFVRLCRTINLPPPAIEELSTCPLPVASDFPDDLVKLILPYFSFNTEHAHFIRLLLASHSIALIEKATIINAGDNLSPRQFEELQGLLDDYAECPLRELRKHSTDKINNVARAIIGSLILARWFGMNTGQAHESALVRSIIAKANTRGLSDFLAREMCASSWNPAVSYVFRHALPPTHIAWRIAERVDLGLHIVED